MLKKSAVVCIAIVILCFLPGCSLSSFKLLRQGKKNAVAYIEGKYHFSPKVISVERITESTAIIGPDLSPRDTGVIRVYMEFEGKSFETEITGTQESLQGYDNYQYEEIENYVKNTVFSKLGIIPHILDINYGDVYYSDYDAVGRKHGKHLIHDFFEETNLFDIQNNIPMQGCPMSVKIIVSNEDITDIDENDILNSLGDIHLAIYNFKDSFDLGTIDETRQHLMFSSSSDNIGEYLIFIEDKLEYGDKDLSYTSYAAKSCDDIYYITDKENKEISYSNDSLSLYDVVSNAPELNDYMILTKTFDMVSESAYLTHFWIPVKNILDDDIVNYEYLLSYEDQNGRSYYHNSAYKTCDYQYVYFSVIITDDMKDVKVTLIGK